MAGQQDTGESEGQGVSLQLARAAPISPGTHTPGPGQMRSEIESLRGFKGRVDRLLEELTGSDADSGKLSEEQLLAAGLGGEFMEASSLHKRYALVLQQLTQLSRMLSGQVGGLGTAVRGATGGYESVDEDARRHMWALRRRLDDRYDPKLDPYAVRNEDGSYEGPAKRWPDSGDDAGGQ